MPKSVDGKEDYCVKQYILEQRQKAGVLGPGRCLGLPDLAKSAQCSSTSFITPEQFISEIQELYGHLSHHHAECLNLGSAARDIIQATGPNEPSISTNASVITDENVSDLYDSTEWNATHSVKEVVPWHPGDDAYWSPENDTYANGIYYYH